MLLLSELAKGKSSVRHADADNIPKTHHELFHVQAAGRKARVHAANKNGPRVAVAAIVVVVVIAAAVTFHR